MRLTTEQKKEITVLLFSVFLMAVLTTWVRTSTVKDTYAYVHQERDLRRLQQEIQAQRIRWLKLTSPKRLESLAHNLGLAAPGLHQTMKYSAEKEKVQRGVF